MLAADNVSFICFAFRILRNKIGSLGGPGPSHSSLHSAQFPVKQSSSSASSSLGLSNRWEFSVSVFSRNHFHSLSALRRPWPTLACTSTSLGTQAPPLPMVTHLPQLAQLTTTTPAAAPQPSLSPGRVRGPVPVVSPVTPPGDTSGHQHQAPGARGQQTQDTGAGAVSPTSSPPSSLMTSITR